MCYVMAAAAIISGISAVQGLRASKQNSEMQAAAADRQAKLETATGRYNAERQSEEVDRVLGQQIAAAGASGMDIDAEVGRDTAISGDLDIRAIRWQSQLAADTSRFEASIHRTNASNSSRAMPFAFAAPILGAMGSFGGGGGGGSSGTGTMGLPKPF